MKGRVYREIYMLYFFAHFKKVIKKPLTFCYGRGRIGIVDRRDLRAAINSSRAASVEP